MWIETIEPEWPLINADKIVAIKMVLTQKARDRKSLPSIPEVWGVYAYCKADPEDVDWVFELCAGTRQDCRDKLMTLVRTQTKAARE